MWVALSRAGCCVVAFGGSEKSRLVTASASARSDIPLLWRRLVVVAPTRQWLCRWLSAECLTKSQWGAAWSQLCHGLQSCKLVPVWDPRPGSSLGCLAATGRVKWTLASPAAVAEQCRERCELGRYSAGTRTCTCHQQYGALLAASAVSVARPGNNDHRPLRLAQRKRVENSRASTRPLRPSATCWTSGDNAASAQPQCYTSLCHWVLRRGRSLRLSGEATENTFSSVKKTYSYTHRGIKIGALKTSVSAEYLQKILMFDFPT